MTNKELTNALVMERNRLENLVATYRSNLNRLVEERNVLHNAVSQILDIDTTIATPTHMRQAIRAAQYIMNEPRVVS